eukprot:TRINITY_DN46920_c0_g1_i1.p1 TRINITY_DN46920_c0_g1~~TRINITY_DN46920_c0_g1_i1.p1  ORF type:complete len:442 (+),score=55.27 TRINITY_DN46920_c0_g1_i1:31-1356(+)
MLTRMPMRPSALALTTRYVRRLPRRCFLQALRYIHAKEYQSPTAIRNRKLDRPREDVNSHMNSNYVLDPTKLKRKPGWTDDTSKQRAQMQRSRTPKDLLQQLRAFVSSGEVDPSVFGAAMQQCGQSFWWDALLQIDRLRRQAKLTLHPIERNIFLTALARCVRNPAQNQENAPSRQKRVLQIAQRIWGEVEQPLDEDNFNIGLGVALTVCIAAGEHAGLCWAEELWSWAEKHQHFQIYPMEYTLMARALEEYACYDRVDKFFQAGHAWMSNVVMLGALLNIAAKRKHLARGEHHWDLQTRIHGVKPNIIAVTARAKLYLLCGRPRGALQVTSEVMEPYLHVHETRLQAAVITYHSTLSKRDLRVLRNTMQAATPSMKGAGKNNRTKLKAFERIVSLLQTSPADVAVRDLLVTPNGKESVISTWQDCFAESDYFDSRAADEK